MEVIEFKFKRELWKVQVYQNRIDIFVDALGQWTFVDTQKTYSKDPVKDAKGIIRQFKQYKEPSKND